MSDEKIIKFAPKAKTKVVEGFGLTDKQALDNYQTWINIIKHNIEILQDSSLAGLILQHSPFDYVKKAELSGYSCGFISAWLDKYLEDLEHPNRKNSYLNSYFVQELDTAMQLMDADHLVKVSIWTEDNAISIHLARTWEHWHLTNIFIDGVSVWEAMRDTLKEKGWTDKQLYHWVEEDENVKETD